MRAPARSSLAAAAASVAGVQKADGRTERGEVLIITCVCVVWCKKELQNYNRRNTQVLQGAIYFYR